MFEDQLFKISRFEHQGKFVKAANFAREFDAAHQIDRDIDTVFPQIIQEAILYVLGVLCIVVHFPNRLSVNFICLFIILTSFKRSKAKPKVLKHNYSNRNLIPLPVETIGDL